jgi:transposase
MRLWDPFIKAANCCIIEAQTKICFDRYHVAQHFGKALDKIRAQEHRWFLKTKGASPLNGTKDDWQRNSGRTNNRGRRDFMVLSRMNLKPARAWAIKEIAAQPWHYRYRGAAEKAWGELLGWIELVPGGRGGAARYRIHARARSARRRRWYPYS